MKRLLFVFVLLIAKPALAGTNVIYSKDGSKATVLIPAFLGENPDSTAFYQAMNVPEEDTNGKRSKRLQQNDSTGVPMLDAICVFSKLVNNEGSCTIVFHPGPNTQVTGPILLKVKGEEAANLSKLFTPSTGEVFHSTDGHMTIIGTEGEFSIEYH
jgi:hypothetical protein